MGIGYFHQFYWAGVNKSWWKSIPKITNNACLVKMCCWSINISENTYFTCLGYIIPYGEDPERQKVCFLFQLQVHLSRSKNKHLIPILLENVEWPLKKSSGEPSPMQLAFTQLLYINLHDQTMKEDEFKKLITTIKKRLGLIEEGQSHHFLILKIQVKIKQ